MADQKVTELTVIKIAQLTALLYLVTIDVDGVATSVAMSLEDLQKNAVTGVNRIISGQVVWTGTGFTHTSVQLAIEINGIIYYSDGDNITNSAPDGSNPRFDVIFFDSDGLDIKEGTPAASPTVPSLDNPLSEVATNIVLVTNGETTPTGVILETLYSENLQESGGEWDSAESTSDVRIHLANTDAPINLTKDVKATAPNGGDTFDLQNTTPILISSFQNIRHQFLSLGSWKGDYLRVGFYDGATDVGYAYLNANTFKTNDTSTVYNVYKTKDEINWVSGETQFDKVEYLWIDGGGATPVSGVRFQVDLIKIEHGGITTTTKQSNDIYVSPNDFTGTDTEKIQQAVDAVAGTDKYVLVFRKNANNDPWDIEEAITLASNTSVIIDGTILKLTDTSRDNFFRTENCGFGITSPFDELENIHILGINGATLVGADDPRATGDAGKDLVDDGTDLWNKSYGNDTGVGGETQTGDWRNIGILFAYTDKFSVIGLNFEEMHMWAINAEKCTRGRIRHITCEMFAERTIPGKGTQYVRNNDMVHVLNGCSNFIVEDITGISDDDTVGVTILDMTESEGVYGTFQVTGDSFAGSDADIFDFVIKDIISATQAHNVRLMNPATTELYDITIENITDTNTVDDVDGVGAVVIIGTQSAGFGTLAVLGDLYNVSINNIMNKHKPYAIQISGGLADSNISNVIDISTINNDYPVEFDAGGVGARNVQLSNIFKTDEANDLIAWINGDPAVRIAIEADFTNKIFELIGGEFDLGTNSIGGTVQTATGDGTTTIDWKLGNMFDFQFGAFNETFTFTAPTKPGTFILKLVQDSVGSRTVTWPGTVKWVSGTAPTLTTTATTGTDIITFYYNGTSYFGVEALDFS